VVELSAYGMRWSQHSGPWVQGMGCHNMALMLACPVL
jgi:hypothetical protein